jgi:AcrR family transcriptional regulator
VSEGAATRDRILEATHVCICRDGLPRATVEAVAQEGGIARATIYRHFPGGRDELLQAVVTWEVSEFLTRLAADAAEATDFADWLSRGLFAARRRLDEHEVLQQALQLEADQLLRPLVTVMPVVKEMLRDELAQRLAGERLRSGVDRQEAADVLARLLLSFMGSPGGWRLDDRAEVDRLVRQHLLAGIIEVDSETKSSVLSQAWGSQGLSQGVR